MINKVLYSVVDFLSNNTITNDLSGASLVYKDLYSKLDQYYPIYFDVLISVSVSVEHGMTLVYGANAQYYNYIENYIQFNDLPVFLHEGTHSLMQSYFNNTALPYPHDNKELKLEYKSSVNLVLHNIANKLGLYTEFENTSMSIRGLKQESSLDLFSIMAMPSFSPENFEANYNKELGAELIGSIHSKYAIDMTYNNIISLIIKQIRSKNLVFSEKSMKTISILGRIIYLSSEEELDKELIATLPELYCEESADIEIFLPIHNYWESYIHPLIVSDSLFIDRNIAVLDVL